MKNYLLSFGLSFLILLLIFSCKKDKSDLPKDMGYEYYPYQKGQWLIYDVHQIYYNDFTQNKEISDFQIKEYFDTVFTDNSGNQALVIERYTRKSDTAVWNILNVCYSSLNKTTAERVEDNIRYIKLIFPVSLNATWNGNAENSAEPQNYRYTSFNTPYEINNKRFEYTLSVLHIDDSTAISKDYSSEVFAKNVGMIYKKYVHLEKEVSGVITKGIDYSYTINSYGN